MLRVKPSAELEELAALLKNSPEVKKRLRALERTVASKVAESVKESVVAKAPADPTVKPYVNAIEVVDVDGHPNVAAITAKLKQDLSTVDTSKTLALFPQAPGEAVIPTMAILRQYEPWAIDKLPPVEVKEVVFREVTEGEVNKARVANNLIYSQAEQLLTQAGVKFVSEFTVSGTAMLDLANLAMRIEFGAPGVPRAMHWRPGVKKALRGVFVKQLARDPEFQKFVKQTLFDPKFGDYRQETPPAATSISVKEAEQFEDFQERLT